MHLEEWRPVLGFEGYYEVSDQGRVRRLPGGQGASRTGRILRPRKQNSGYYMLALQHPGRKKTTRLVHRIVAEAFIGACPPTHEVHHEDAEKSHNAATNLRYVTRSENMQERSVRFVQSVPFVRRGGSPGERFTKYHQGANNPMAKLTNDQVRAIRAAHAAGDAGYQRLADRFGASKSVIRDIVKRKSWQNIV